MNGDLIPLNRFLIGDWLFKIPIFQRSYAWEQNNLQDLWDDLHYLSENRDHYFGTVLLRTSEEKTRSGFKTFEHLDVIDGQQRLITVLILLREVISQMKDVGDEECQRDASKLEEQCLRDGVHYKLTLLGEDGDFFRESIMDDKSPVGEPRTAAQRRLRRAKEFFRSRLDEEKNTRGGEFVDFLVDFKNKIDRLQLMQYRVSSGSEAIRIFETVNDRGRPLINLEKTKSILMYASYLAAPDDDYVEQRLQELHGQFSKIYRCHEAVDGRMGQSSPEEIQRYHFVAHVSGTKRASHDYMDVLKERIMALNRRDPEQCLKFVRDYAFDLKEAFVATEQIVSRREQGQDDVGETLENMFDLERVGSMFSLLIACWRRFGSSPTQILGILQQLEAFAFRVYRVGRYRSDAAETSFNELAQRVQRDGLGCQDVVQRLQEMNREYMDDLWFRRNLGQSDFYHAQSGRTIKFLLAEYEMKLRRDSGEVLDLSRSQILSEEFQVEHIWAQRPKDLAEDARSVHEEHVDRLGNLTLAARSWNQEMGNRPFQEKKTFYRRSSLRVQRGLARRRQWTDLSVRARTRELVAFALERWAISYELNLR